MGAKKSYYNPITGTSMSVSGDSNKANAQMGMDTNITNYKIAEQANATNIQLQQEQQAYERQLWADTNAFNIQMRDDERLYNEAWRDNEREYNSPAAMRERLVQAGYNPLILDGSGFGGSGGSSGGSGSSPSVRADQPDSMNPYPTETSEFVAPQMESFAMAMMQASGIFTDVAKKSMEMIEMPQRLFSELDAQEAEAEYKRSLTADIFKKMSWQDQISYADVVNTWADTKAKQASSDSLRAGAEFVRMQMRHYPDLTEAKIRQYNADASYQQEAMNRLQRLADPEIAEIGARILEDKANAASAYSQVEVNRSHAELNEQLAKESESRVDLNNALTQESSQKTRGLTLENNLTAQYGEEKYKLGLDAARQALVESKVDLFMRTFEFEPDSRPLLLDIFDSYGLEVPERNNEFMKAYVKARNYGKLTFKEQWLKDAILKLLPNTSVNASFSKKF